MEKKEDKSKTIRWHAITSEVLTSKKGKNYLPLVETYKRSAEQKKLTSYFADFILFDVPIGQSKWNGDLHSRGLQSEGNSHGGDLELPLFDLETIAAATEGFSTDNKLGEGGFGPVYKVRISI